MLVVISVLIVVLRKKCATAKPLDINDEPAEPEYAIVSDILPKAKAVNDDADYMKMDTKTCYALTAVQEKTNFYEEVGEVKIKMKENDAYMVTVC